jgi:hypothetical protein
MAQQTKNKDVSLGAFVDFLGIQAKGSSANLDIHDSTKIRAAFTINDATMTVIDDNIREAFERKEKLIVDNIKTLGLDNAKLYLIIETIRSPKIDISLTRSSSTNAGVSVKIVNFIKATPNAKVKVNANNSLAYELGSPLVVFYKLRGINVNVIGTKGSPDRKIAVSLGPAIQVGELPLER